MHVSITAVALRKDVQSPPSFFSEADNMHTRSRTARDCVAELLCACRYPTVPLLALTATATPRVQADVVQQLCLKHCVVFRSSFNRTNLR